MNGEPTRETPGDHSVTDITITRDEISQLVDLFYQRVWADARLGPIFQSRLADQRQAHLERMKQFWASVLLRSGEYHGQPVPKHKALNEVVQEDFARWLSLFRKTAYDVLDDTTAALVMEKAERIAQSLWLAMFGTVGASPPAWLKGPDYDVNHRKTTEGAVQS